eukprot:TRINITY_DN14644_c0_g1_i2.p1 TRINITY_DN14644_c0_g1~~TRINITY_DN14644_c0_g1_i2.p1  ORF type:complete len:215 (+),score=34.51 TRINITY_DN14644_c0_g1_i2:73-717(+)
MASSQHFGTIECEVATMGGSRLIVHAKRSWKVWQLKEKIAAEMKIPMFEQHLVKDTCMMRNGDTLISAMPSNHSSRLNIGLSRWSVPDTLSNELVSLIWQGYLAFSKDCGETIDGGRVPSLMRYAGLHESATLVSRDYEIPGTLRFDGLVNLLAALKESLAAASNLEGLKEFDLADDSDEDSEEVGVHARLAELNDADLMGDARLILNVRRNSR